MKRFAQIACVLVMTAVASAVIEPGFARQKSSSGLAIKQSELESDGYTCVRVATNFIECTKPGKKTYWCDDRGNCEQARKNKVQQDTAPRPSKKSK